MSKRSAAQPSARFDTKYSWLVCFSGFILNVFAVGQVYSYALYFTPLTTEFKQSTSVTSWVGSITLAALLGTGVLTGKLLTIFGLRKVVIVGGSLITIGLFSSSYVTSLWPLYVSYGLLVGCGASFCYMASIVGVSQEFDKYKSAATGIVVSGSGIGTLILAPILNKLIPAFGWRSSLRIQSAMMLAATLIGALVFRGQSRKTALTMEEVEQYVEEVAEVVMGEHPHHHHHQTEEEHEQQCSSDDNADIIATRLDFDVKPSVDHDIALPSSPNDTVSAIDTTTIKKDEPIVVLRSFWQLATDRMFLPMLIGICIASFGYFIPFVYLVKFGQDKIKLSYSEASWAVSALGGFSAIGRVGIGLLSDVFSKRRLLIFIISAAVNGLSALIFPFVAHDLKSLLIISVVFGLSAGAFIALAPVIVEEATSKAEMAKALGLFFTVQAPTILMSSPLAGLVVQSSAGYDGAFVMSGVTLLVGTMFIASLPLLRRRSPSLPVAHVATNSVTDFEVIILPARLYTSEV